MSHREYRPVQWTTTEEEARRSAQKMQDAGRSMMGIGCGIFGFVFLAVMLIVGIVACSGAVH
jgi:hypothetical protein